MPDTKDPYGDGTVRNPYDDGTAVNPHGDVLGSGELDGEVEKPAPKKATPRKRAKA